MHNDQVYGIIIVQLLNHKEGSHIQIQEITLLTSTEYQRLQHLITNIQCTWWLQDEGKYLNPYSVSGLDAAVTDAPNRDSERYVRPAMRITGVQYKPGAQLSVFAYSWTVLESINDVTLVLCDTAVTCRPFDTNKQKWSTSEIKFWLKSWLEKRQKTSDNQKHKCYKRMNEIGMAYLTNDFLRYWLTPMMLLLPIALISCQGAWSLYQVVSVPQWLHRVVWYLACIHGVCITTVTLYIAISSHKDTLLRHILNTICFWGLILLLYKQVTILGIVSMLCLTVIAVLNCSYLRKIKYYS